MIEFLFAQAGAGTQPAQSADAASPPTGAIQDGALENGATQAVSGILPDGTPQWVQTAVQYGIPYAIGTVKVIIILFITWIVAGIVARFVLRGLEKARLDLTLAKFFAKMARWTVLLLGLLACLSIFGVETTSFAAVIGAAGLAIGLAFQGTLSNFASGVMLLVFRPFKVGHFVIVNGVAGTVNEIDLFSTTLDTTDNRRLIIPNSSIFSSTIENVSFHSKRRVNVNVGTAYDADLDRTRLILENTIGGLEKKLSDPEPAVVLLELGDSAINWELRVWVRADDFWDLKQQLIRDVKYALDENRIGIPYPQMDIHVDNSA